MTRYVDTFTAYCAGFSCRQCYPIAALGEPRSVMPFQIADFKAIQNIDAVVRGEDFVEGGKFCYSPFDLVSLASESEEGSDSDDSDIYWENFAYEPALEMPVPLQIVKAKLTELRAPSVTASERALFSPATSVASTDSIFSAASRAPSVTASERALFSPATSVASTDSDFSAVSRASSVTESERALCSPASVSFSLDSSYTPVLCACDLGSGRYSHNSWRCTCGFERISDEGERYQDMDYAVATCSCGPVGMTCPVHIPAGIFRADFSFRITETIRGPCEPETSPMTLLPNPMWNPRLWDAISEINLPLGISDDEEDDAEEDLIYFPPRRRHDSCFGKTCIGPDCLLCRLKR